MVFDTDFIFVIIAIWSRVIEVRPPARNFSVDGCGMERCGHEAQECVRGANTCFFEKQARWMVLETSLSFGMPPPGRRVECDASSRAAASISGGNSHVRQILIAVEQEESTPPFHRDFGKTRSARITSSFFSANRTVGSPTSPFGASGPSSNVGVGCADHSNPGADDPHYLDGNQFRNGSGLGHLGGRGLHFPHGDLQRQHGACLGLGGFLESVDPRDRGELHADRIGYAARQVRRRQLHSRRYQRQTIARRIQLHEQHRLSRHYPERAVPGRHLLYGANHRRHPRRCRHARLVGAKHEFRGHGGPVVG